MPSPGGSSGDSGHPTLEDLKRQLNRSDERDDVELQVYLDSAIEVAESILGGPIEVTTFTERHQSSCNGVVIPYKRPLVAVTSVTPVAYGTALDAASYTPNATLGTVTVTGARSAEYTLVYEAGYATLPSAYKLAILIIAQHLWRTQHGGGGRVAPGEEAVVPGWSFAIPNRALELLGGGGIPAVA
jgi:hypothetical protein